MTMPAGSSSPAGGAAASRWPLGESEHWALYLNADQSLLGRCHLALKRPETSVTALTDAELQDLWSVTRRVEKALRDLWDPDHFNFAFLMNQTPQVHWHVIPRYKGRREFAGGTFVDPEFGGHYGIGPARTLDDIAYGDVAAALTRAFNR
jgi:diadenosine tetraphosphate (Ap4A) HIT family hydrolase